MQPNEKTELKIVSDTAKARCLSRVWCNDPRRL